MSALSSAASRTINGAVARAVSAAKGAEYRIDPHITGRSLVAVAAARAVMKLRGELRFATRPTRPFVGVRVTIRHRNRLSFGRATTFADGVVIDALSVDGVRLGEGVSLGRNTRIECTGSLRTLGRGIVVGDNVGLGADCFYGCAGGIRIGADTIVGNFVSFHSENHNVSGADVPIRLQGETHAGITVGGNCWFGARCTILDGAVIEDGCVFAAGSVVTAGHYLRDRIYGGVPAKLLKPRVPGGSSTT